MQMQRPGLLRYLKGGCRTIRCHAIWRIPFRIIRGNPKDEIIFVRCLLNFPIVRLSIRAGGSPRTCLTYVIRVMRGALVKEEGFRERVVLSTTRAVPHMNGAVRKKNTQNAKLNVTRASCIKSAAFCVLRAESIISTLRCL